VSEGLQLRCVAEIFVSGPRGFLGRFGSGYALPGGLILTAAHVIADRANSQLADILIEVRTLADWEEGAAWLKAKLVWPPHDGWAALSHIDIALLQLDPGHPTRAETAPVRLDWKGLPEVRDVSMVAVGFPKFKYDDRARKRATHRIQGDLSLADHYVDRGLAFENKGRQLPTHAREAKVSESWKGLSGAALFAQEEPYNLVAVVTVALDGAQIVFNATRLKACLDDPLFAKLVTPAQMAAGPRLRPPSPPRVDLRQLVCRIDRELQVTSFEPNFAKRLAPVAVRPLCCVVVGARLHEPPELAVRLRLEVARLSRQLDQELLLRTISWPRRADDVAAALARLQQLLWQHLRSDRQESVPNDEGQFRLRINDRQGVPLLLQSELPGELDDRQAALLVEWLAFWDRLGAAGLEVPTAHLLLVPDASEVQVRAWMQDIPELSSVGLVLLPELEPCFWQDLLAWLEQCVVPDAGVPAARVRDLEVELVNRLGGGDFALRQLKETLTQLLAPGGPFGDLTYG
jgi:hypothetical protein